MARWLPPMTLPLSTYGAKNPEREDSCGAGLRSSKNSIDGWVVAIARRQHSDKLSWQK